MRSTVFDVDPTVNGRIGGEDDKKLNVKPFAQPYTASRAPPPVDVSDTPLHTPQQRGFMQPQRSDTMRSLISNGANGPEVPLPASPGGDDSNEIESILDRMREALRARGAVGIRGLARNFQICDVSRDRKLQREELGKCLQLCRIKLSNEEFEMLFGFCDADDSGSVDYDEFLKVLRGRMPPLRRKLVGMVFRRIDQLSRKGGKGQGDGMLTADDLMHAYSGKDHPDVKAGKKPESAVLQEMLQQFEGQKGNRDGQVSLDEWIGYYEELSASIENDDHFDQVRRFTCSGALTLCRSATACDLGRCRKPL